VISNKVELKYSLSYWFHTGLFGLIFCSVGFASNYLFSLSLSFRSHKKTQTNEFFQCLHNFLYYNLMKVPSPSHVAHLNVSKLWFLLDIMHVTIVQSYTVLFFNSVAGYPSISHQSASVVSVVSVSKIQYPGLKQSVCVAESIECILEYQIFSPS
jgi:hypothetical protein